MAIKQNWSKILSNDAQPA